MGIADWFSFETAKQKKKKMDRYYKKLYPFGEEQKNWEQDRQTLMFMMRMRSVQALRK